MNPAPPVTSTDVDKSRRLSSSAGEVGDPHALPRVGVRADHIGDVRSISGIPDIAHQVVGDLQ